MEDRLRFLDEYSPVCDQMPVPDAIRSEYEVLSCLKPGADRQVYLLRSRMSGAQFVLKLAPRAQLNRFTREYEILLRLHDKAFPHPAACFAQGDQAYFLREYVPGRSLAECVEDDEPFPEDRAVAIAREVCRIVQRLHEGTPPVIHRDIKPQNLILSPDGAVRLVDLDSVEEFRPEKSADTMLIGTAATAAPEQFGYRRCDQRTDVYAIGMLITYLLTGDYAPAALRQAAVSKPLKRLVERCVQFDPERRFPSVKALADRLASKGRRPRRRPFRVAGTVLALAVAAFAAVHAGAIAGFLQSASILAAEPGYAFSSPLIERAVRLQLGRERGRILESDLDSITQLNLCGGTPYSDWYDLGTYGGEAQLRGAACTDAALLRDLSDLNRMPRLEQLSLCRLGLKDLGFLDGLPLTHLSLYGNQISDISALANLKTLQALDLSDNPVFDLTPLTQCPALEELAIGATGVTDLSPLGDMNLRVLKMMGMRSDADLSVLGELNGLEQFSANGLDGDALQAVFRLTNLKNLMLFDGGVESLRQLAGLKRMISLNLRGNELRDLDGVEAFERLDLLELSYNHIASLEPLRGRGGIRSLWIAGNPLTDLTPLITMPDLKEVIASEDQRQMIEALPQNPDWVVRYD